jgi:hypothetical protein
MTELALGKIPLPLPEGLQDVTGSPEQTTGPII